eukprot:jgi/Mesen1/6819/ME000035S06199
MDQQRSGSKYPQGALNEPFYDLLNNSSISQGGSNVQNNNNMSARLVPDIDFSGSSNANYDFQPSHQGSTQPSTSESKSDWLQSGGPMRHPMSPPHHTAPVVSDVSGGGGVGGGGAQGKEAAVHSATVAAVEQTMKKYADNLLHVLEDISGRLRHLESATARLETAVRDVQQQSGDSHGQVDGRIRSMENLLYEVQRGVQVLRDRQEIAEAQAELAKMQVAAVGAPSPAAAEARPGSAPAAAPLPPQPAPAALVPSALASAPLPASAPSAPPSAPVAAGQQPADVPPPQYVLNVPALPAPAQLQAPPPPAPDNYPQQQQQQQQGPQQMQMSAYGQPQTPHAHAAPAAAAAPPPPPLPPLPPHYQPQEGYQQQDAPPQYQILSQQGQPPSAPTPQYLGAVSPHQQMQYGQQQPPLQQQPPPPQPHQPEAPPAYMPGGYGTQPQQQQQHRGQHQQQGYQQLMMGPQGPAPPPSYDSLGGASSQRGGQGGQLALPGPYTTPHQQAAYDMGQGGPAPSQSAYGGSSYRVAQPVPSAPISGGGAGGGGAGYPRLQLAQPVQSVPPPAASSERGGAPLGTSRVPIDKVIDDVAAMGFSKEQVHGIVRRLTENGQSVDLNIVLDKLMNGGAEPPKGWFGR